MPCQNISFEKIVCVNIALEHFYGASDNSTKFVSYIVQQLLASIDTIDLTKGEQKRDFIYIDDVISAFLLILNESKQSVSGYFEYEIGTGICISIRDFVELAKKLIGNTHTKLNFGAIPYRNNEVMETHVNTSKLRALGWKPDNLLIDGLSKMIKLEREVKNI
jgi:nucleoside-diphosphate-sugar epimerase